MRTGAPITVHTNAFTQSGLLALDFFAEEGVDLTKVVIGHAGDSNDLDYLMRLADTGATSAWTDSGWTSTTRPRGAWPPSPRCARGYADRMVLSHDAACFMTTSAAWDEELNWRPTGATITSTTRSWPHCWTRV